MLTERRIFIHVNRLRSLGGCSVMLHAPSRSLSLSLFRSLDVFAYSFAVRLQIQLVVNETAARANVNGQWQ